MVYDELQYLSVLSVNSHGTIGLFCDLFHYRPGDYVHTLNGVTAKDIK